MAEIKHVVSGKEIEYKGLCSIQEMYRLLENWFSQRRYSKSEKRNYEEVNDGYKCIDFKIAPEKKISDYIKAQIEVTIFCNQIKDVDIDLDGRKETVQEGDFKIKMDGKLYTDYENKWEMKPFYFFLRTIMDKFVFKGIISRYENDLKKDVDDLMEELKAFLNVTKLKHGA